MTVETEGEVAVLLPDGWAVIELQDDAIRRRSVRETVDGRLGGPPELAELRGTVLEGLLEESRRAALAGGVLMAVADEVGTPPASLTVYRVAGRLDEQGRAAMARVLSTGEPGHTLDIGEGAAGVVLRRVRPGMATSGLTGPQPVPALIADYWVEPAPGTKLVYLVFSSPLVEQRDALLTLFDTIVASVRVLPRTGTRRTRP